MLASRVPTRWRLFSVLFLLSFLSYLMRQNIHVAGEFMMPELGITEIEMGWIYAAFIWGYGLCQLPGGVFGKLLGHHELASHVDVLAHQVREETE